MHGHENQRRLWGLINSSATISSAALAWLAFGSLFASWIAAGLALVVGSATAAVVVAAAAFPLGVAVGVLFVHPVGSAWVMRRQCEYETVDLQLTARFEGSSLRPAEWRQRRTIKALQDGVTSIPLVYRYGSASAAVTPQVIVGGTITDVSERPSGPQVATLKLSDHLRKGDTHLFELRTVVPGDAPDSPPWFTVSPTHPTRTVSMELRFGQVCPRGVWVSYWLSSDAEEECQVKLLHPDRDGLVKHTFHRLKPGHKYGLTWDWDDRNQE